METLELEVPLIADQIGLFEKKKKRRKRHSSKNTKDIYDLIRFVLNGEIYGIELKKTQEIVRAEGVVRIPRSANYFSGMINLRGTIIAVIDLKKLLGFSSSTLTWTSRILIVQQNQLSIGLLVDQVKEIIRLEQSDIVPPHAHLEDEKRRFIRGMVEKTEHLVAILDLEKIYDDLNL